MGSAPNAPRPPAAEPGISRLGEMLRARRRQKRLSLRDLADQTGVSFNTLSRVERGHVPDLRNLRRIAEWLEVPVETFVEPADAASTPEVIARHLSSDQRLSPEAATKIARLVEDMYHELVSERPPLAVHLRSARTFTPAAGAALAELLQEMQNALTDRATK
jgi:transcriptional regulator with XRE-family HTH domain